MTLKHLEPTIENEESKPEMLTSGTSEEPSYYLAEDPLIGW